MDRERTSMTRAAWWWAAAVASLTSVEPCILPARTLRARTFEEWAAASGIEADKIRIISGEVEAQQRDGRRSDGGGKRRKRRTSPQREYLLPETLRGAVATVPIAAGDTLCRVPTSVCLDLARTQNGKSPCEDMAP